MAEDHWIAGYLYHDRQDSRLLVPWRGGRGHVLAPVGFVIWRVYVSPGAATPEEAAP
jgi:uncharacterized membrane protein